MPDRITRRRCARGHIGIDGFEKMAHGRPLFAHHPHQRLSACTSTGPLGGEGLIVDAARRVGWPISEVTD